MTILGKVIYFIGSCVLFFCGLHFLSSLLNFFSSHYEDNPKRGYTYFVISFILLSACASFAFTNSSFNDDGEISYSSSYDEGYYSGYEDGLNDGYEQGFDDAVEITEEDNCSSDYVEGENTVYVDENYDTFFVTTQIHLRSGPGTEYSSLCLIPKGEDLCVLSSSSGLWKPVVYEGFSGYVSSDYLSSDHISSELEDTLSSDNDYSEEYDPLVWLSETGLKYHSQPNCGNMNLNAAYQVPLSEALSGGYDPCSKCY